MPTDLLAAARAVLDADTLYDRQTAMQALREAVEREERARQVREHYADGLHLGLDGGAKELSEAQAIVAKYVGPRGGDYTVAPRVADCRECFHPAHDGGCCTAGMANRQGRCFCARHQPPKEK